MSFPWWWQVVVDPEPMNGIDPPPETVMLEGMAMIGFSEGTNVQNPAESFPLVDGRGLPLPMPDGRWTFDTEILSMDLRGHDSLGREVILRLDETHQSLGQVLAEASPEEPFLTGDSFFDVFFDITVTDVDTGESMTLAVADATDPTQRAAVQIGMTFDADTTFFQMAGSIAGTAVPKPH